MLTKVGWETIESLSSVCGQTTVGDYFFSDQKWEVMKWLQKADSTNKHIASVESLDRG